jgi:arylsulfatase A-like enzyme
MKNVIVLVVDRLGAGYLGPYGNTWIDTPSVNRLAAQSMVVEFAIADTIELPRLYRSYWRGQHAAADQKSAPAVADIIQPTEIHSALVTDAAEIADLADARSFDERLVLTPSSAPVAATEIEDTELARVFAATLDWMQRAPEPFLLWVHARGMEGAWDAPLEFRNQFADEDDPSPPTLVRPPMKRMEPGHDPDELLGLQHAYAGQVALLDVCLGAMLETLDGLPYREQTMMIATSPRGYPLGEHGRVGACDLSLYGESIHVPWLLRLPRSDVAGLRCLDFVQPPDLCATVLDWLDLSSGDEPRWGQSLLPLVEGVQQPWRDRTLSVAGGFTAFRSRAWALHRHPDGRRELYAKPDDRLEANEVSTRCPEAIEGLEAAAAEFSKASHSSHSTQPSHFPTLLLEGLD